MFFVVFNIEIGEVMEVVIELYEFVLFDMGVGLVMVCCVCMIGSLIVDFWYDEVGNWVGCEFEVCG